MRAHLKKTVFGVAVVDIDGEETMVPPGREETPEQAAARWVQDAHGLVLEKSPDEVLVEELNAATTLAELKAVLLKRFG